MDRREAARGLRHVVYSWERSVWPDDIIVIGTSSGGVEALIRLFRHLPEDLPAAVFVVVHFPQGASSVLPSILNHAGSLKAVNPEDGDAIT